MYQNRENTLDNINLNGKTEEMYRKWYCGRDYALTEKLTYAGGLFHMKTKVVLLHKLRQC